MSKGGGFAFLARVRKQATERLIQAIEEDDGLPWKKGWSDSNVMPYNPFTGVRYHGGNVVTLMMGTLERGSDDPRWMTLAQANKAGYLVRPGAKAEKVEYWSFGDEEIKDKARYDLQGNRIEDSETAEAADSPKRRPTVFYAHVYNGTDIIGLPEYKREITWKPHVVAEALLDASGAKIVHRSMPAGPLVAGNQAYYSPARDEMVLPPRWNFASTENYYQVAIHELAHWTGHSSRLNRGFDDVAHGTPTYAREELRAEMASLMLCHLIGVGGEITNHAKYTTAWCEVLKNDRNELFRAAADAEKIVDHLFRYAPELRVVVEASLAANRVKPGEGSFLTASNGLTGVSMPDFRPAAVRESAATDTPPAPAPAVTHAASVPMDPVHADPEVVRQLVILTPRGYVAGFDENMAAVQFEALAESAKRFSRWEAKEFYDLYADAGFGLDSATASIELPDCPDGLDGARFIKVGIEYQFSRPDDHEHWPEFARRVREVSDRNFVPREAYELAMDAIRPRFDLVLSSFEVHGLTENQFIDALVGHMVMDTATSAERAIQEESQRHMGMQVAMQGGSEVDHDDDEIVLR